MPTLIIDTGAPPAPTDQVAEVQVPAGSAGDAGPHGATDDLVPIVLFLAIALTYCVKYYFAHRTRQASEATLRVALERGEALTPELVARLAGPPPGPRDLRRGVIGVCLGIGIGAAGFVISEPGALRPMLAVGLVPLLLGLAYLVLWRLGGDKA